jgi:cytochrome c peroxidase
VSARRFFLGSAVVAACACVAGEDLDAPWTQAELKILESLRLDEASPPPPSPGNKVADDPAAARLGRALFFDAGLSRRADLSCARCHLPERYFTDGLRQAAGTSPLAHNTPSLVGVAAYPFLTWNGRADSVWSQALDSVERPREMGRARTGVARHVYLHHREAFEAVFGPMPDLEDAERFPDPATPHEGAGYEPGRRAWATMSAEDQVAVERVFANFGKALEAWQRTLRHRAAPFDRYVAALLQGDPSGGNHLSPGARRGLRLFIGKAGCVECHHGPLLTDFQFHNVGVPPPPLGLAARPGRDEGAHQLLRSPFRCGGPYSDTTDCEELRYLDPTFQDFVGAFRTPSLRNVEQTAPYMHAGQFLTLDEAVEFYRRLPGQPAEGHRVPILRRLGSTVPNRELVLFLRSLTGPLPEL